MNNFCILKHYIFTIIEQIKMATAAIKLFKVVIFGATGGTGLELCRQAAEAGHTVTAYVRSPEKLAIKHPNIVCVRGTLEDAAAVEAAVRDKDAVLVALGSRSLLTRDTVCSAGTRVILDAMKNTGVRRIVVCSSFGVGPDNRKLVPWFLRIILYNALIDKDDQEADIQKSDVDWIIARPVGLVDEPARGNIHVEPSGSIPVPCLRISRADVAAFMLGQLEDRTYVHKTPTLCWSV